jgi:S-methylmethionine-dependent homocysteine/selenocysteine methylase
VFPLDAIGLKEVNEDIFETAKILVNVGGVLVEIENRIADDLTGAVVGNIATPINPKHFGAVFAEFFFGGKKVIGVASLAKRINMFMLREEQNVADKTLMPQIEQSVL